jgi:hypothetical protein
VTVSGGRARLHELSGVALEILPAMVDEPSGLFSHKTLVRDGTYENRGANGLYSAAAMVGILSQRHRDPESVVPVGPAMDALHATATSPSSSPALAGTALWASCLAGDPRGEGLATEVATGPEPRTQTSMELGLALTGLVAAFDAYPALRDAAREAAGTYVRELLARFSPRADLFGATGATRSPGGVAHSRLTSFATQVYALHGLAAYVREIEGSCPDALPRVARRLLAEQGPLGQWWWFYSLRSGEVIEGYPVYAVHQDAMAFMALTPLRAIGLETNEAPLERGIEWLFGANELERSLVRSRPSFICRCIQRAGSDPDAFGGVSRANRARMILRSLGLGGQVATDETLEVLEECRSYHLGWLLYADALVSV